MQSGRSAWPVTILRAGVLIPVLFLRILYRLEHCILLPLEIFVLFQPLLICCTQQWIWKRHRRAFLHRWSLRNAAPPTFQVGKLVAFDSSRGPYVNHGEERNVCDRKFVAHEVLAIGQPRIKHAVKPLKLTYNVLDGERVMLAGKSIEAIRTSQQCSFRAR